MVFEKQKTSINLPIEEAGEYWKCLTNRTQCVQMAGSTLKSLDVAKGVLQGSVLGPVLFSVHINNLLTVCQMLPVIFMQTTPLFIAAHFTEHLMLFSLICQNLNFKC